MIIERKRICFVATVDFAVNAFLLSHLKKLSEFFDITVVVNTADKEFLKRKGVDVTVIPLEFSREISFLRDLSCLISLMIIFFRGGYFSVHSITPKAGLLAAVAAFCVRTPLRIHTFTGQVWVNKKGFNRSLLKMFDCLIGKLSTFNIVDSPSQRGFLIQQSVLTEKKSIVFGSGSVSGVDLKKFKASKKIHDEVRSQLAIPENALVYIYLGRFNKDKGLLDLVAAFSRIEDDRAYLIMVGPDEANLTQQLNSLVGDKRVRMRFVGFSGEPQRYLAASDVLCLPSYREGFGFVIIEAAAMGVPAIASNIYGISDAVQNQKTGLLHPPKDVDAILSCMEKLLQDPMLVKSYGLAARKRAVTEFDAKMLSQYWLDFYLSHVH